MSGQATPGGQTTNAATLMSGQATSSGLTTNIQLPGMKNYLIGEGACKQ